MPDKTSPQKPAVEGQEAQQQQEQPLQSPQPAEPQPSSEQTAEGEQHHTRAIDRTKGGPKKIQAILAQAAHRATPGPVLSNNLPPEEGSKEERLAQTQEMNKDN